MECEFGADKARRPPIRGNSNSASSLFDEGCTLPPPLPLPLPPLGALHLTIPHTLLPNPRCHLDSGLGCHSCAPSTECNATTLPPALPPLVHYTTQYHTCCLTQAATPCHPCHRSAYQCHYFRDCYTMLPFNATPLPLIQNAVPPVCCLCATAAVQCRKLLTRWC